MIERNCKISEKLSVKKWYDFKEWEGGEKWVLSGG